MGKGWKEMHTNSNFHIQENSSFFIPSYNFSVFSKFIYIIKIATVKNQGFLITYKNSL